MPLASGPQESLLSLCFSLLSWGAVGSQLSLVSLVPLPRTGVLSFLSHFVSTRWWHIHPQLPQHIPVVPHLGLSLSTKLIPSLGILSLLPHFTMAGTSLISMLTLAPPALSVPLLLPLALTVSLLLLSEGCQLCPPAWGFCMCFGAVCLCCRCRLSLSVFTLPHLSQAADELNLQ